MVELQYRMLLEPIMTDEMLSQRTIIKCVSYGQYALFNCF